MRPPRYVAIENQQHLVRDTFSMGVINTNTHALNLAKQKQQEALKKVQLEQQRNQELNTLRNEVAELKALVQALVNKIEG
jgi:hypothetical protein